MGNENDQQGRRRGVKERVIKENGDFILQDLCIFGKERKEIADLISDIFT